MLSSTIRRAFFIRCFRGLNFAPTCLTPCGIRSIVQIETIFRLSSLPPVIGATTIRRLQFGKNMAFFSPEKLRPRPIEIDESTAGCDSPDIQRRLDRIEQNYRQLDAVLGDIEDKLSKDDRLTALDNDQIDFESEFGIKPKRKWRPAKTKPKRRRKSASAHPRKPR